MHTSRPHAAAGSLAWTRLLVVLLARAYRAMLLTLTAIALLPLAMTWGSFVVESGSMEPSIAVGDVVLARPTAADHRVRVGRVYVFEDPEHRERLMVHRVVERRDDGDYTTAGDANDVTDLTPVAAADIHAQAVLLVPFIGLPVHWLHRGQWGRLAVWLLLTVAAFVLAGRRLDDETPGRMHAGRWRKRTPPVLAPRRGVPVATSVCAVLAVGALTTGAAQAGFTARTVVSGNTWTAGTWVQPYVGAVLADKPFGLWLLDEARGMSYAQDRSGNNRTGQYYDSLTLGQDGGLLNNPGTSVRTSGGRVVLGPQAMSAPNTYSIELWFRTSSGVGGYLAGFEDDRDDSWWGATADRLVKMEANGRLTFGAWGARFSDITTPRAYNDGAWHHLVVTSTSARASMIYVDGVAVASGTTSAVDSYTGYWRIGQGSTGFFHGVTSSFHGELDNVAIYHSVLPPARVAAHWAAR